MIRLHRQRLRNVVVSCLALLSWPLIASVESSTESGFLPRVENLRVGFDNTYKLGCWTPVEMKLERCAGGDSGASGRIEIQAPDNDGVPVRLRRRSIIWTMGQAYLGYAAKIGRPDGPTQSVLAKNRRQCGDHPLEYLPDCHGQVAGRALPATNELIVQLGGSIGLPEYFRHLDQSDFDRTTVVTLDKPQPLPDKWYGYEGVDLVVIVGLPAVEKSLLSPATIDALEQWVRLGGTLLAGMRRGSRAARRPRRAAGAISPGEYVEQSIESRPFEHH